MKRRFYIFGMVLTFAAGAVLAGGALEGSTPGGPDDPLVSRSYVDLRINELRQSANFGQVNMEIVVSEALAAITAFYGDSMDATFTPVFVSAGRILLAGEGTEIILRSGTARAHVPGADGIVNVTTGIDVANGVNVAANNLLIVPREDGRGIFAVTDTWFIVKGSHSVVTQ